MVTQVPWARIEAGRPVKTVIKTLIHHVERIGELVGK